MGIFADIWKKVKDLLRPPSMVPRIPKNLIEPIICTVAMLGDVKKIRTKALGVAISLVAAPTCSLDRYEDSQMVIQATPYVLYFLTAGYLSSDDTTVGEICQMMKKSYHYSQYFLDVCIQSNNNLYKDTGKMVNVEYKIVDRVCSDKQNRAQFLKDSACTADCIERNRNELESTGLLISDKELSQFPLLTNDEVRQYLKKRRNISNAASICSTTRNYKICTTKTYNSIVCRGDKYQELQSYFTNTVDDFCSGHKKDLISENTDVLTTTVSATTAGARIPSLLMALPYLEIVMLGAS